MPPKRGKKGAPQPPPLEGCKLAFSGAFRVVSQAALKAKAEALGATVSNTVTNDTTHLIATEAHYNKREPKVMQAISLGIPVVSMEWLTTCEKNSAKPTEKDYVPGVVIPAQNGTSAQPVAQDSQADGSDTAATKSRKRSSDDANISDDKDTAAPKTKRTRGKNAAAKVEKADMKNEDVEMKDADNAAGADSEKKNEKVKAEKAVGEGQIAKSKDLKVPLDEGCPYITSKVYIDDDGVIYDVSLNKTDASKNNNKFYRIQVLVDPSGTFRTWTRWGRVGERGQTQVAAEGTKENALKQFEKKFKDKSGLAWSQRGENPKPGKYAFVERNYEDDSDEEYEAKVKKEGNGNGKIAREPPKCTLHPAVQRLMELIFNAQYFAATMASLNYDSNKLPLGKLSKATISRGFQVLKDLSNLIDDPSLASNYGQPFPQAIEQLSNSFYSIIPHAFGRNRPPVIRDRQMIKKEVELLESLSDMKDADLLMKLEKTVEDDIHPLERQYRGLNMKEMTPLDPTSEEFIQLQNYLNESRGVTHGHSYRIEEIFRIERQGEHERFDNSLFGKMKKNRRLLWHGSRVTNFGGILSQGLRIAPPEAPSTGYMFDKGIYLADMSSKSANYCHSYLSGGTALLLLCEAELGDPMQEFINAAYNAATTAKQKGMIATWGKGRTGPLKWKSAACVHPSLEGVMMPDTSVPPGDTKVKDASLWYNEYICYDVAQVRLRYLFRIRM